MLFLEQLQDIQSAILCQWLVVIYIVNDKFQFMMSKIYTLKELISLRDGYKECDAMTYDEKIIIISDICVNYHEAVFVFTWFFLVFYKLVI